MSHIAFDIGNVICDLDLNLFINKLVDLNIVESSNDGMRILVEIQNAQDIGLITLGDHLRDVLKVDPKLIPELMNAWFSVIHPNDTMIKLIKQLKGRGVEIALLSNIGYDHAKMLRTTYGDMFNEYIQHFSCEVGARKPSKLFFQSFLIESPKFDSCIYLDDIRENVEAANRAGFRARLFDLGKYTESNSVKKEFSNILKSLWF